MFGHISDWFSFRARNSAQLSTQPTSMEMTEDSAAEALLSGSEGTTSHDYSLSDDSRCGFFSCMPCCAEDDESNQIEFVK